MVAVHAGLPTLGVGLYSVSESLGNPIAGRVSRHVRR